MKTEQIRPRLETDEAAELKRLADACGMNPTTLAGIFIRAVIRAVKEYGEDRRFIPLHLQVTDDAPSPECRFNDKAKGRFCSYHLAKFRDAAGTAMEAGHTEEMLFRNYRELLTCDGELITPALAGEFWNLRPESKFNAFADRFGDGF